MARPRKHNAEYFPHECNMRNHRKVKALRSTFGITGYATYCMTLEMIANAEGFTIDIDEVELKLIASDFGITTVELLKIWDEAHSIRLLEFENNQLSCSALIERLQPMLDERERQRVKANNRWNFKNEIIQGQSNTEVLPRENHPTGMQSKVKESKVEESNKNIGKKHFSVPSLIEIQKFFSEKVKEKNLSINPNIEAEKFESFYSSKNWMVGKNKMTDWKKAASGWITRMEPTRINGTPHPQLSSIKKDY